MLILVLWILEAVPLPNIIPNTVLSALKGVMNYIAEGFGDVAAYMDDPAKRDAIRQRTTDILREYEENNECKEIIVFAHSLGTVVAYDVLSDRTASANPKRHKYKSFICIGSILSPVERMYRGHERHKVFYDLNGTRRRPKSMKWLFLYAR